MKDSIKVLHDMEQRMEQLISSMHEQNLATKPGKHEPKRYTMKDAAEMVGRSYTAIREAEKSGALKDPEMGENNRRLGYTLHDINAARDHFKTRLRRDRDADECVRLAFANFKGVGEDHVGGACRAILCRGWTRGADRRLRPTGERNRDDGLHPRQ